MRSRIFREGTVGLFALIGLGVVGVLVVWLGGDRWKQQGYQLVVTFKDVSGLRQGAAVNYRGVQVGKVANLEPGSNNVRVTLNIDDSNIRIPPDAEIQANSYGLIGESVVDITPQSSLTSEAEQVNPNSDDCQDKNLILCNQDQLTGSSSGELTSNLANISETLSDPEFLDNIKAAAANAATAGQTITKTGIKIDRTTDEINLFAKTARQEIQGASETLESIQSAANQATNVMSNVDATLTGSREDIQRTIGETAVLMENLNEIVADNRDNIERTIVSIEKSSNDLQKLVANLDFTITEVNRGLAAVNTPEMAQNLEQTLADARQTSANLRQLSDTINDPATIATLTELLDSARVTFDNFKRISSEVDAIIGDPELMDNLRRMINGLSDLVSSTEQLQKEMATLERLQQDTTSPSLRVAPFVAQPEIIPIDPKTARYQILTPEEIANIAANKSNDKKAQ